MRTSFPPLIVVFGVAAYANSLSGPFIFDDVVSIQNNWRVRQLWPPDEHWYAEPNTCQSGRPFSALTFAINFAIHGYHVQGYHILSVAFHIAVAMALYGVIRRFIIQYQQSRSIPHDAAPAVWIAFLSAGLFVAHPLATDAINHVSYRNEVIMALFYLLTMYGLLRQREGCHTWMWGIFTICMCALGMASKENMVSAPVMVFLVDRTLCPDGILLQLKKRWGLYVGLACTWLVLWFSMSTGLRGPLVGFSLDNLPLYEYVLTELGVFLLYLRLAIWPHPLILDYQSWPIEKSLFDVVPELLAVGVIVLIVLWAAWRRKWYGLSGILMLMVLAPTSLIPNAGEVVAEHRMYLPLAALISVFVIIVYRWMCVPLSQGTRRSILVSAMLLAPVGASLAYATIVRNRDYRSAESIWRDTVGKNPTNYRALNSLAKELMDQSRVEEAMPLLRRSLEINPNHASAINNLGRALLLREQIDESIPYFEQAIARRPNYAEALANLCVAYQYKGDLETAWDFCQQADQASPGNPIVSTNIGAILKRQGKYDQAIQRLQEAVRIKPNLASAYVNWGSALHALGKHEQALEKFQVASNLGEESDALLLERARALIELGELERSLQDLDKLLARRPSHISARFDAGRACFLLYRYEDAIAQYEAILKMDPVHQASNNNLSVLYLLLGNYDRAEHYGHRAVVLDPRDDNAHVNLAQACRALGKRGSAIQHYEEALRLNPQNKAAQENLQKATRHSLSLHQSPER